MQCNIHVNKDICISTLLPSSVCCIQTCPVTTVTKHVPRLRLYPGHSESGHTIGWLIAFFGLKKPFHHYLSLSLTSFLSPPTPSYSLCTYLHLGVFQVNKSHSVWFFSPQDPRGKSAVVWHNREALRYSVDLPVVLFSYLTYPSVRLLRKWIATQHFVVISIHGGLGHAP